MRAVRALRMSYLCLSVALLALITALPAIQVVMRNIFAYPLIGSEEYTKYFLICLTFMAAPVAASGAGMIVMDELRKILPKVLRVPLTALILLACAGVFALVAWSAMVTSMKNAHVSTALGLPFWVFILPGTLGFSILAVEYATQFASFIRNGEASYGADAIAEDVLGVEPSDGSAGSV